MIGSLAVMDRTGDTKMVWDSDKPAEVEAAKAMFDKMKKQGYMAYSTTDKGKKGDVMQTFDPNAESIIMAPALAGG